MDGQGTKCGRNIDENFNRLTKAHERYRQTDRQTTDGRVTAISGSLNTKPKPETNSHCSCKLLTCVCVSLCTTTIHNAAQNSSDNFPFLSYRQSP